MARTRELDAVEIRVLGALMEKEQTTPDYYPMTINAVIAACNQKTGRDPIMQLNETAVVEALDRLATDVLTWRSVGPRSERWEHRLDRRWRLDRASKAIMTLLLLRGPQTPGELRTRSERMHGFASPAEVETVLVGLSEGEDALVRALPRQPGKREVRWIHLAGNEAATAALAEAEAAPATPVRRSAPVAAPAPAPEVLERLDRLEADVAALGAQLRDLMEQLGS